MISRGEAEINNHTQTLVDTAPGELRNAVLGPPSWGQRGSKAFLMATQNKERRAELIQTGDAAGRRVGLTGWRLQHLGEFHPHKAMNQLWLPVAGIQVHCGFWVRARGPPLLTAWSLWHQEA